MLFIRLMADKLFGGLWLCAVPAMLLVWLPPRAAGQELAQPAASTPLVQAPAAKAPAALPAPVHRSVHRFWDRQNDWLFAGVGAARTLDYFSTLNMRRRGRQEILLTNDAVDNHAAFAAIEAAATAASIGASWMFHHCGHHRLERWTSYVHIGLATSGAVRNYSLESAHPAPPVP